MSIKIKAILSSYRIFLVLFLILKIILNVFYSKLNNLTKSLICNVIVAFLVPRFTWYTTQKGKRLQLNSILLKKTIML